ncbi:DUF6232 family protein [Streptomyces lancefieldiae]|uniref:DUF6232 family protein n=1 Tax=Streptomyces lancefieldiae TaxID=3075520 RepID=A0ABU3AVE5_9ACTN|nr:DUF6232 family protein [Streptomyces sp. DSM 40712]MDT0613532.1 DUF6232 family protein [Streptomyces sp. DSM 40712]
MERPENPETPPQQPPQPPPAFPAQASGGDRPWHNRVAPPPPPPLPPHLGGGVEMRISKRLLWVGGAAYPLRNITRVYTFLLSPRRGEATVLFFKRVGIILPVAFAMTILGNLTRLGSDAETAETITKFVWFGAVVALIYCAGDLGAVLTASSHWVLAVETSGASTALVTSKDTQHLNQLVGHVVHAIENPEAEFQVRVDRLTINPRNYYFGDNVNMYGGTGNVGMRTAA